MRLVSLMTFAIALAACDPGPDCPAGLVADETVGHCVRPDAGTDAGSDAATPVDASGTPVDGGSTDAGRNAIFLQDSGYGSCDLAHSYRCHPDARCLRYGTYPIGVCIARDFDASYYERDL